MYPTRSGPLRPISGKPSSLTLGPQSPCFSEAPSAMFLGHLLLLPSYRQVAALSGVTLFAQVSETHPGKDLLYIPTKPVAGVGTQYKPRDSWCPAARLEAEGPSMCRATDRALRAMWAGKCPGSHALGASDFCPELHPLPLLTFTCISIPCYCPLLAILPPGLCGPQDTYTHTHACMQMCTHAQKLAYRPWYLHPLHLEFCPLHRYPISRTLFSYVNPECYPHPLTKL